MTQYLDIVVKKKQLFFVIELKTLGFKHAFKAGISFGKDDLIIPKTKENLINETKKKLKIMKNNILMD